jgi:hypothetical protein
MFEYEFLCRRDLIKSPTTPELAKRCDQRLLMLDGRFVEK